MTKTEKQWICYDVGNSAFVLLLTAIIPIYFKNIATAHQIPLDRSTVYWSYGMSICTIIVMFLGPLLGSFGDIIGYRKKLFTTMVLMGVVSCGMLAFANQWLAFLAVFIVTNVALSLSVVFNDGMLPDITTQDRIHRVSAHGFAWGYAGSCVPFVLSLGFILFAEKIGITKDLATKISFWIVALWWLLFSLPLMLHYKQIYGIPKEKDKNLVQESFHRLKQTFLEIYKQKPIFTFLFAYFFYIDGIFTIIKMATIYGKDVGISDENLLLALLLTQLIAFPCAIGMGNLTKRFTVFHLLFVSILFYIFIVLFATQLDCAWEFWVLAICVGFVQGGVQALSRSHFSSLVPKEQSSEFFGIYDIFGKGAAFLGTFLVGIVTQITKQSQLGVGAIGLLLIVGLVALYWHQKALQDSSVKKI